MTKNEIISALFISKDFNDCINSRCPPHLKDDLKAEIALLLCEKKECDLVELHERGQLRFYIVRVILNQLSKNGQFYKKYRRIICIENKTVNNDEHFFNLHNLKSVSMHDRLFINTTDDQLTERIKKESFEDEAVALLNEWECSTITSLWYKAKLFKLYLELGNYRAVSKLTRIPFTSVHLTLKEAGKEVRAKLCRP